MSKSKSKNNSHHIDKAATSALKQQSSYLNIALIIGAVLGVCFFVYTYLIFKVNPVPILGQNSLSKPALGILAILIFILFWIFFNRANDKKISPSRFGLIFNSAVLSLATAIIGTVLLVAFTEVMASAFKGLEFDVITASIIIWGVVTAVSYLVINFASSITIQRIYGMLLIIMFGCILISAIASNTPGWYDIYLSALGMSSAGPIAELFNFALIYAGIMLIAMANVLFQSVKAFYLNNPRVGKVRTEILYTLFILAGLFLAGIGLFPFVEGTTQGLIHQISAAMLGVVLVLWMWFLRLLIPFFENSFYNLSIALGVGIATIYALSSLKIYFNTTGLELTVFVIGTAWLGLFISNFINATIVKEVS